MVTLSAGQKFFKAAHGYLNLTDWRARHSWRVGMRIWAYVGDKPENNYNKLDKTCNEFLLLKIPKFQPPKPIPLPQVRILPHPCFPMQHAGDQDERYFVIKATKHVDVLCPTCERINTHCIAGGFGHRDCDRLGCFGYELVKYDPWDRTP